jgi:transcriptional regulator with XRE-family HTH domain
VRTKTLLRCLGEELRERRLRRGLSQEALAHAAGVHPNVIGRLERGIYNPSILTLQSVATMLNVALAELFASAARRDR